MRNMSTASCIEINLSSVKQFQFQRLQVLEFLMKLHIRSDRVAGCDVTKAEAIHCFPKSSFIFFFGLFVFFNYTRET